MTEHEELRGAITALEAQRSQLGDAAVDAALEGLRQKLTELEARTQSVSSSVTPEALSGERKLVTVMFADFCGFTARSESTDPEQVRGLMNACFDLLVPIIERLGGVVDKFIGDEIMALFGAPVAHENHAERALLAALQMRAALTEYSARQGLALGMHFGINTGLVVAGGLGSEGRRQYSVMGDTVNLAARLEDLSERGQILVGPTTRRLTEPLFSFEPLPPIQVKGKAGLVAAHEVIGLRSTPGAVRGIAGLRSSLVGRDEELRRVHTAVQRLASGAGGILTITGEPGVGKSRLVAEARQRYFANVRWVEGRALSHTEGMSYWMIRSLLDNLIGVRSDTPPHDTARALRSTVEQLFPDAERLAQVYPYLARLRDLPLDAETEEQLRPVLPGALQKRMRLAFGELLRALAHLQPLALVCEDLHWADPSSLGLLKSLLPVSDEVPLLLVLVFRPQEGTIAEWHRDAVGAFKDTRILVELSPLAPEASRQLVENLLRIENLPESAHELILAKAEGNPFFLEELLRSLIDSGLVVLEGGRAVATQAIQHLEVPDTVQGVVAARVDRLPPQDKRALQDASVIGRVFQRPILAYLLEHEGTAADLDTSLTALQHRELVRRRAELEYIFKHAVTQDVAYNSLLIVKRRDLHRMTAEAIEDLFSEEVEELSAALAYHYERGEVPDKTIHYFTLAADRARRAYSNVEAIAFYRAALKQVAADGRAEDYRQTAELHERLGDVHLLNGQSEEARRSYQDAVVHTAEDDRVGLSRLRRKDGNTWMTERQFDKSLEACHRAENMLGPRPMHGEGDWQHEWLEIRLDQFWAHYWANQVQELIALAESTRPHVQEHGTPIQRAKFFRSVVMMEWRRDRFLVSADTLGDISSAVDAAHESGDLCELAFAVTMRGMCHLWRRDLDEAEKNLRIGLELSERIGDVERQILGLTYLAVTYRCFKRVDAVRQYAERSLHAALAGNMPFYIGSARANLAWADWFEGRPAEALAHVRAAMEAWGATPNPVQWLALWPSLAVALAEERNREAIDHARLLIPPPAMRMPEALESLVQAAIEHWDEGETEEARAFLTQAAELAQRTGWL